jgi:poly(hydroxyalkanoate) depolymerase family esterase
MKPPRPFAQLAERIPRMAVTLAPSMADALRLTRAGNLAEATRLLRAALGGGAPGTTAADPRTPPSPPVAGPVLDLMAERVRTTDRPTRAPRPGPAATPGGAFVDRRYSGPMGSLEYKLYTPPNAAPGMPLVVMLHGCTQSPDDFARGTGMNLLADELGFIVAYPAQSQSANPQKCWNWFRPGDQQRDRGEPALIAGATREIIAEHGADKARVYIAGLSAGGAAAAIMGAAYPDLYAGVGVHSGLACGVARDLPSAMMAMSRGGDAIGATPTTLVPTIVFHGDADRTVHLANGEQVAAHAHAAAPTPLRRRSESGRSPGGRAFTRATSHDHEDRALIEHWTIHGAGHAWAGGSTTGSYTDPGGPDASREMMRFFLQHRLAG